MITLTGTLTAAQRSASARPYAEVYVDDRPVEVPRLDWSEVYQEVWTGDRANAAVVAFDGSIVRAVARNPGAGNYNLHVQRITDPTVGAQWSTWSGVIDDVSAADQTVALYADSASGLVRCFYVKFDNHEVRVVESADNGATWGAPAVVLNIGAALVRGIAADWRAGDGVVVYGWDPAGVNPDDKLCVGWWDGVAWQNFLDLGRVYTTIHSLGVGRGDDGKFTIAVSSDSGLHLDARRYELGVGFSSDYSLLEAGSASGYAYVHPFVRASGPGATGLPRYVYVYLESYAGTGTNKVVWLCTSPVLYWLASEVAVDIQATRGCSLLLRSDVWYLVSSYRVLKAAAYVAGTDRADVSGDLVVVDVDERGEMKAGSALVVLDNADGAYQNAGVSGAYKCVKSGSQVALKLGYVSTAGNEAVWASPWWIERVVYEDVKGVGYLRLECMDAWGWLERITVRRQMTFTRQTLNYILLRVLWTVCKIAEGVLHANLNVTAPTFVWSPGESMAEIARRVLRMSGLWLRFKTDVWTANGAGWDSVTVELVDLGSGASTYSYGSAAHQVKRAQYGVSSLRPNDFAVVGKNKESYQMDYAAVEALGRVLYEWIRDKKLDTQAKVDAMADYLNYEADVGVGRGFIEVQANVGQQVGDVIDVTDSRANLAAATRRVGMISTTLERRGAGKFAQKLKLVGV